MKNIPLLLIVLAIGILGSCEKENAAPAALESAKINPTESYLTNIQTKVLFASLKINHEEESVNGWLINWKGELRKINNDLSISLRDEFVTGNTIEDLHNNSEWIATLDKEELVQFHRQATKATTSRDITTSTEMTNSSAYVSYLRTSNSTTASHSGEDCEEDDSASNSYILPSYEQDLLMASGQLNLTVTSPDIQTVTDYLNALEESVDF